MTLDSLENLLVDRDGAVATVTINRPKVLNALSIQTSTSCGAPCCRSNMTMRFGW